MKVKVKKCKIMRINRKRVLWLGTITLMVKVWKVYIYIYKDLGLLTSSNLS